MEHVYKWFKDTWEGVWSTVGSFGTTLWLSKTFSKYIGSGKGVSTAKGTVSCVKLEGISVV